MRYSWKIELLLWILKISAFHQFDHHLNLRRRFARIRWCLSKFFPLVRSAFIILFICLFYFRCFRHWFEILSLDVIYRHLKLVQHRSSKLSLFFGSMINIFVIPSLFIVMKSHCCCKMQSFFMTFLVYCGFIVCCCCCSLSPLKWLQQILCFFLAFGSCCSSK